MMVTPISRTILFKKGSEVLSAGNCYYIEDERILRGDDMDVILAVLGLRKRLFESAALAYTCQCSIVVSCSLLPPGCQLVRSG